MAYTMAKGATRRPMLYTLKNGFDRRIVERITKKGFWILPLVVVTLLGLATLTSNQWYGHSDQNDGASDRATATTSQKGMNRSSHGNSTSTGTKESLSSTAPSDTDAVLAGGSTTMSASSLQKAAPLSSVTGVLGGKGGGGDTSGTASSPSVTQPVTDVIEPVTSPPSTSPLPDTSPVTDPLVQTPLPVDTTPLTDPLLGCTPDILGLLPSTC